MGLFKRYMQNAKKPEGLMGNLILTGMNTGHAKMAAWGTGHLPPMEPEAVADLGCGGGRNASVLLKRYPKAVITALDYSAQSVAKTQKRNRAEIRKGRCCVFRGDVSALPLADESFDLVTAYETVYFWPGPLESFREVYRVTRPGGYFLIVNETDGDNEEDRNWETVIDGMKIHTVEEMKALLKEAGFPEVRVARKREDSWVCFLAHKE